MSKGPDICDSVSPSSDVRITTLSAKPLHKVSWLIRARQGIISGDEKGGLSLQLPNRGNRDSLAYPSHRSLSCETPLSVTSSVTDDRHLRGADTAAHHSNHSSTIAVRSVGLERPVELYSLENAIKDVSRT